MYRFLQIKKIQEDGSFWTDMPNDNNLNPCTSCGACCNHYRVSFYQGEITSNGGFVPVELVTPITPFLVAMQGTENGGKCIAFEGEVGKQNYCKIYNTRSSTCRSFAVWLEDGTVNPRCQELRKNHGLLPIKVLNSI